MKKIVLAVAAGLALTATAAQARDNIEIVGSSTVYPFSTTVAEQFSKKSGNPAPKVESTGSGGGFKMFCEGAGVDTPDITNSSRRMKASELENCQKNGVDAVTEVKIGFDGIAIANSKQAPQFDLSMKDIYLALAATVPNPEAADQLIANPYKTWKQVNDKLPDTKIEVLGPPPTSGTRDAFVELAMQTGCQKIDMIKAMKKSDAKKFAELCDTVREDGAYVEAGENDNLIVQKLGANPNALGIFGFSFLEQNADKVQGSKIDGVEPSFETIASGAYPVSRPLFFYVKNAHVDQVKGIREFVTEFTSDSAWGEGGYLSDKGLIPLPDAMRAGAAKAAADLKPLTAADLK